MAALAMLFMTAGSANAVTVEIQFDDFEAMGASGISADATQEANSGWRDITNKFDSTPGNAGNNNARTDVSGHDGNFSTTSTGRGVRVRSSTGSMTLDDAMQLTTLGATSVSISLDLLEVSAGYFGALYYSDKADWDRNSLVLIDSYDGSGNVNPLGTWVAKSYTLSDGVDGINFTDDAFFVIGKRFQNDGSGGANSTFHIYDNIRITAELANPVPEPATATLAMLGLGGLVMRRRRANA